MRKQGGTGGGGFRLVSASPLAFVWPDFATAAECDALVSAGDVLLRAIDEGADEAAEALRGRLSKFGVSHGDPGFRRVYKLPESRKLRAEFDPDATVELGGDGCALVRRFESTIADFLQCPPHADEDSCVLNLTPGRSHGAPLESGLHVDTFNDEPRRFATAILYLSSLGPEEGGQTIFPLAARAPPSAVAAGEELLRSHVESTLEALSKWSLRAAAEAIEAHAAAVLAAHREAADLSDEASALSVRPRRGSLMVFFTRDHMQGDIDGRSWHGSAAIAGDAKKWTLQTFKAAPLGQEPRAFAAERAARHAFAVRASLPPAAFRALRPLGTVGAAGGGASAVVAATSTLGPQRLVEEEASLPGGVRLRIISAHVVAGPLCEGVPGDLTGLALWPAPVALSAHVTSSLGRLVVGRRVLDLGCGCGLVGLAALAAGAAHVVLLDSSPEAVELARRNAAANIGAAGKAEVVCSSWRDGLPQLGKFGLVLASDVLYPSSLDGGDGSDGCNDGGGSVAGATAEVLGALEAFLIDDGEALMVVQRRSSAVTASLERAAEGILLEQVENWCSLPSLQLWHFRRRSQVEPSADAASLLSTLD